jgi:serine/threonine-protein kinase HipA
LSAVPGDHDKATVLTEEYIVKTGPHDLPGLAINEYLCLEAARRAGIEVPETTLSADGKVLAIRRFDRRTQEELGVEDFCALKGLSAYRKYEGSHEDLAKLLKAYAAVRQLGRSREQLFRLVALNYAVQNADAHLKNYAMLYSSTGDARLAPAYDMLTVPAYPEFHRDIPGLTLYGKKTWSCGKLLLRYAQQWLDIRAEAAKPVIEQVSDALRSTAPEVKRYADNFPEFREVGKRMLEFWDRGITGIQPDSRASVPSPGLRESTGLSDPKRRRRRKRNPLRGEDGGFSHKVR